MAAESVLNSTYMDDSMDSIENNEKGVELYQQLSMMWEKSGMHARKWISNFQKVLERLPQEDRASEINLNHGELPSVKTLGIIWKANEELFTYHAIDADEKFEYTKRNILKKVATIFDPLG